MNKVQKLQTPYDVAKIRHDFPVLNQTINGQPLIYLDNAATTQKPMSVISAIQHYYLNDNANIHRGVHTLSIRATTAYELAREAVRKFINAHHLHEIIFVRGATEGINVVAQSFLRPQLKEGDEIIITTMEHHSNIVPWQILCEEKAAHLRVVPINDAGELDIISYEKMLNAKTKLVALTHISNAIGTVNPVEKMIQMAHLQSILVLVDGAQAASHTPIDVQALNCDFYVFSSHKMYGPTGIGVLYGKSCHLEAMTPYQAGGDMISEVSFEKTTYNKLPYKFEAGTPHIAGAIGLHAAIEYLQNIGFENIMAHEQRLLDYAQEAFKQIPDLKIIGQARKKTGSVSFVFDHIHPHDVGTILDHEGIAIRAGHHCAMPLMTRFNLPATSRASFGIYNTVSEIDALVAGLYKVKRLFS